MKLLVLSDSHREEGFLLDAARREQPDALIHLGDYASDAEALEEAYPLLPLRIVRGNCDYFDTRTPEEAVLCWQGVKIFAVHGHRYQVKSGLLSLRYAALEKGAQVALFGHTHCPYCEYDGTLWMMNPGACGGSHPCYGIVEIENGAVRCRVKELYSEEDV